MNFKEIYSQPNLIPEKSPFSGRNFIRDWPKRCPTCQDIFFARRLETEYHEPYRVDPEPDHSTPGPVMKVRETCGHPQCQDAEEIHQLRRTPYFGEAHAKAFPGDFGETNAQPKSNPRGSGLRRAGQ